MQQAALPAPSWSPEQTLFMAWLAMPETQRQPRQQRDLAVELGFSEQTLSNWKHTPGFGDEVFRLTREFVKSSDLARIMYAQVRKAVKGDTAAARFVYEMTGVAPDPKATGRASVEFDNGDGQRIVFSLELGTDNSGDE